MSGFIYLLAASATIAAAPEQAAVSEATSNCPDVLDYGSWKESEAQLWDFRGRALTIIGASHSRDPRHEQFERIENEFVAARPSLAFFEGPERGTGNARHETIEKGGESAFLRLLAREAGIPARTLEPSPGERMQALASRFQSDQVLLFFVLREAARLRDREHRTGEALTGAVQTLLERVSATAGAAGIRLPFSDLSGLESAFARYWPDREWRTADARWFSPGANDADTGGLFMAAINRADSSNRDRHMVKLFADAVARGERPFVVVGRNHVPMISPALACRLGENAKKTAR